MATFKIRVVTSFFTLCFIFMAWKRCSFLAPHKFWLLLSFATIFIMLYYTVVVGRSMEIRINSYFCVLFVFLLFLSFSLCRNILYILGGNFLFFFGCVYYFFCWLDRGFDALPPKFFSLEKFLFLFFFAVLFFNIYFF